LAEGFGEAEDGVGGGHVELAEHRGVPFRRGIKETPQAGRRMGVIVAERGWWWQVGHVLGAG
jgi:hypothetical protein